MRIEVLLSCMHQNNMDLAVKTGITTDALLVSQTDREGSATALFPEQAGRDSIDLSAEAAGDEKAGAPRTFRLLLTTERGLSRSRNMAIENACGDICLLCDDDEELYPDYADTISRAFERRPDAAVIAFDFENKVTRIGGEKRLGRFDCLKLASWQLAFDRRKIVESGVRFDVRMGAGTGNGAQEENKFLWDCLAAGLAVYYVPECIGRIVPGGVSTWFSGYTGAFFYQRGAATRHMMGLPLSALYGLYYLLAKRGLYRRETSIRTAAAQLFKGILENPIAGQSGQADR